MRLLAFVLALAVLAGCAHAPPPAPASGLGRRIRVGVLPAVWLTEPLVGASDPSDRVAEGLASPAVDVVRPGDDEAAAALDGEPEDCTAQAECLRTVGLRLRVDYVVGVTLAELGGTVIVRARFVDVRALGQDEVRQEVLADATGERLEATLDALARAFVAPFATPEVPPPARPWYRRGWIWAAGGAVLAAAVGTTTGVILSRPPGPDVVITPP